MRVAPLHDMGGCGQRGAEGVVFGESHDALLSWIAVLHITGNPKRRRVAVRGWRRDPVLWGMMCFHSLNFGLRGQHEAAADWARKAIHEPRSAGGGYWPYAVLASALGNLGQIADARAACEEALRRKPDLSLGYLENTLPTKQPGALAPYLEGLRKAGLPE